MPKGIVYCPGCGLPALLEPGTVEITNTPTEIGCLHCNKNFKLVLVTNEEV